MTRVWIETSSHVARAGLRSLLEHAGGIEVVDLSEEADVIVRDSAADLIESTSEGGHLPVVVLSDEPLTSRIFRLGVRAILPRQAEPRQIVAAIQAVAAGLVAVSPNAAAGLASADGVYALAEPLTPRELEVLEMLAEGLGNKQIAGRLAISDHTAKFHVNSILRKLEATTRTEAVTRGIRAGILKI